MFGKNADDGDEVEQGDPGTGEDETESPENATGEPAPEPSFDGPDPAELGVRIDEMEDDLDSTAASVRAVRSSQEEMADSMAEMNDTVRQLLGVYDQLMAEQNPFVDRDTETAENGDENGSGTAAPTPAGEEVVSFDDLQAADKLPGGNGHEESDATDEDESAEPEAPHETDGTDEGAERGDGAEQEDEPAAPHADGTTEPAGDGVHELAANEGVSTDRFASVDGATDATGNGHGSPVVEELPDGLASEVLVMEWLAHLMERAGPAGALRAVEHYESVGWIGASVRDRLVSLIGGPSLDVFVDPTRPGEPTAVEHEITHEYLTVLNELDEV